MTARRQTPGQEEFWNSERLGALADRVRASPDVVRLHAGAAGEVAAYLPGARVPGIRLLDDRRIEVHVVMSLHSTVDRVESAVLDAAGDDRSSVDVVIADIVLPDEEEDGDSEDGVDAVEEIGRGPATSDRSG